MTYAKVRKNSKINKNLKCKKVNNIMLQGYN